MGASRRGIWAPRRRLGRRRVPARRSELRVAGQATDALERRCVAGDGLSAAPPRKLDAASTR
jgi:hypothetical protein